VKDAGIYGKLGLKKIQKYALNVRALTGMSQEEENIKTKRKGKNES